MEVDIHFLELFNIMMIHSTITHGATFSPLISAQRLKRSTPWVIEKVLQLVLPNFYGPIRLWIFIYIYTSTLYTLIIIFSFPLECGRP